MPDGKVPAQVGGRVRAVRLGWTEGRHVLLRHHVFDSIPATARARTLRVPDAECRVLGQHPRSWPYYPLSQM
ncbi:hypothetical protein EAO69_43810 [Streptomyces sp. me109]|nr:hypothetical protein EAO69_43810 [Streptomyces sp. me109]